MSSLSAGIKSRITGMLDRYLPSRTKRLMFLASLSARLKDSSSLDKATLSRLNEVMSLSASRNEQGMQVPVILSRAIWDGRTVYQLCDDYIAEGKLDPHRVNRIASKVVDASPAWLRYAGKEEIEKDVQTLLDNRSVLGL